MSLLVIHSDDGTSSGRGKCGKNWVGDPLLTQKSKCVSPIVTDRTVTIWCQGNILFKFPQVVTTFGQIQQSPQDQQGCAVLQVPKGQELQGIPAPWRMP